MTRRPDELHDVPSDEKKSRDREKQIQPGKIEDNPLYLSVAHAGIAGPGIRFSSFPGGAWERGETYLNWLTHS